MLMRLLSHIHSFYCQKSIFGKLFLCTRAFLRTLSPNPPFGKWMHLWQIIRPKKNGTIWLLLAGADYLDIAAILSSFLCSAFFAFSRQSFLLLLFLYKLAPLVSSHTAQSDLSCQPQKNCFMCKSFKCNDFSFGKVISSFQSKDMNEKDNLIVAAIQKYWFTPYLIFVTDTRTVSVEKKSVMWRNFIFLYMTDVEKSKIHPHVD